MTKRSSFLASLLVTGGSLLPATGCKATDDYYPLTLQASTPEQSEKLRVLFDLTRENPIAALSELKQALRNWNGGQGFDSWLTEMPVDPSIYERRNTEHDLQIVERALRHKDHGRAAVALYFLEKRLSRIGEATADMHDTDALDQLVMKVRAISEGLFAEAREELRSPERQSR